MNALTSSILIFVVMVLIHFINSLILGGITLFFDTLKPMLIITVITIVLYVIFRWFTLAY